MNKSLQAITKEMKRQDKKWGDQRTLPPTLWATILGEEYGEFCQAILKQDLKNAREEIVQVGALAAQIIKSIDAKKFKV